MPGRHSAAGGARPKGRLLPASLVLLAAVIIAGGSLVMTSNAGPEAAPEKCQGTVPVSVMASPDFVPVLTRATARLEKRGADANGTCVDYQVRGVASGSALAAFTASPPQGAQLWVPDSSVWLGRAAQSEVATTVLSKSLATTPAVVVGSTTPPKSWLSMLAAGGVRLTDPTATATGAAALLAVQSERSHTGASEREVGGVLVPLAQRYGELAMRPTEAREVLAGAGPGSPAVVTEQDVVSENVPGATVPQTGTLLLDYPLASVSDSAVSRQAGAQLAVFMAGAEGNRLIGAHGFRDVQGQPLADGKGVGSVTLLAPPSPEVIGSTLRQWTVLTVPSRALAVFDVSGSMDFTDGGRSRISLASSAAATALQLFPDTAQIGFWAFSQKLGGRGRDYEPLVPIRGLSTPVDGGLTQRQALGAALARLPRLTQGGTGLYDTTLAAVREVKKGYDPNAINSVILLTDGTNDDPGSIGLGKLLRTLKAERDPARPVIVVAIGMGPEADASALKQIADVTGGRSYIARNPADITSVFQDALLSR